MPVVLWQNPIIPCPFPLRPHPCRYVLPLSCVATSTASSSPLEHPSQSPITSLFQSYGFSDDHIHFIFHKHPRSIAWPPDRVQRKLECLLSFGFSMAELTTLVSVDPHLLKTSHTRLLHNLHFLHNMLGSKQLVKKAIARSSRILKVNLQKHLLPNVDALRSHGVPSESIAQAVIRFPIVMLDTSHQITDVVNELKMLGMNPTSRVFVVAINAKLTINRDKWDHKLELYRSFGWSDDNFLAAFRKHPYCVLTTEWKIKKMMGFYVHKLGWSPVFLSQRPVFNDLSLETRIIPRCAVLEILVSRRLLEKKVALYRLLLMPESLFKYQFVSKFVDSIPLVAEAYNTKEPRDDYSQLKLWQERTEQLPIIAGKL